MNPHTNQSNAAPPAPDVRLAFISGYQGETDYAVTTGPSAGIRIHVRYLTAEAYTRMFGEYRTPAGLRDYQQSAGCVVGPDPRVPVPADVLAAVRRQHTRYLDALASMGLPSIDVSPTITACRWSPDTGYHRVSCEQPECCTPLSNAA